MIIRVKDAAGCENCCCFAYMATPYSLANFCILAQIFEVVILKFHIFVMTSFGMPQHAGKNICLPVCLSSWKKAR